jgi:uncharacterized membrane protein YdjX (TVP38/TMEM64 family)
MSAPRQSFWARYGKWLVLAVALVALTAAWHFFPLRDWVNAFNGWVEQRGAWGIVVFIAAYILATVLFFPGSLLTIAAGLAFGLWRGVAVVSVSATLGAGLAFLLGRYLARSKVDEAAKHHAKFAAMDKAIAERGWKVVALLRLSPLIPFNLSNYLYGVTKIDFWPYLAASWVGMLPGTFLYVYLGAAGREATRGETNVWKWALFGAGFVATIIVTVWISRAARKAVPTTINKANP